ncbi:hypothetical protein KY338_00690 [Candidatus Woesearchaeota archaeon]|nr:hypothetical protein [Candidatus Woesearchaeota archaeon]MBW3005163.1 hypothetical protein [Candidatus Woesearchaeota archaeon]
MGSQKEFDKDLSEYLSGRKRKKIDVLGMIKGIMPKPTPPPVKMPPEIQTYGEPEEKKPEPAKVEEPKVETLEEEVVGEKKSIWQSLVDRFKFKPYKKEAEQKDKMIEEEEEGRIKEMVAKELMQKDMRDMAKITLYVIKQLPPERLKEFKQSTDWTDLKELLKKYKFIK